MFLAIVLTLMACHHWQEAACGRHGRCSCALAALAYTLYAATHALR